MEPEKKSNGAIIGLVVIIFILAIGGIYIWQSNKKALERIQNSQNQTLTSEDSTDLNTLQEDSKNTDTSTGVDANTIY